MKTITGSIFEILHSKNFFVQESQQVAYGGDFVQFPDEKDLLRAHLLVELIERYHYAPEQIIAGAYVPIKKHGLEYAEIDILVHDTAYRPFILCAVEPAQTFEQNFEKALVRLFAMAVLMREKSAPHYLMYYTRWYEEGARKTRQLIVHYSKYQTFESWHAAGRPLEKDLPLQK